MLKNKSYNIKKINIFSVLKTAPIILGINGILSSLTTFFIFSSDIYSTDLKARMLACIMFSIAYTIIMLSSLIIMIYIYNLLSLKYNKHIEIIFTEKSESSNSKIENFKN
jgi:hypothetical protein